MGIGFLLVAGRGLVESAVLALAAILLGALATALGLLFGWVAWTGRVPASNEEYGLDESSDIEELRATARRQGRLEE